MAIQIKAAFVILFAVSALTGNAHADPLKMATAYQGKPNDFAKPSITISDRHITIELNSRPAATVRGVQFAGSGGTFNFSKNGAAEVEPGTYTVVVEGSVGISTRYPDGRIEAVVHYH